MRTLSSPEYDTRTLTRVLLLLLLLLLLRRRRRHRRPPPPSTTTAQISFSVFPHRTSAPASVRRGTLFRPLFILFPRSFLPSFRQSVCLQCDVSGDATRVRSSACCRRERTRCPWPPRPGTNFTLKTKRILLSFPSLSPRLLPAGRVPTRSALAPYPIPRPAPLAVDGGQKGLGPLSRHPLWLLFARTKFLIAPVLRITRKFPSFEIDLLAVFGPRLL